MTSPRSEMIWYDAGESAFRCGHKPGPASTIVWDNTGHAHVDVPRPKRNPERRTPITLRRETALRTLEKKKGEGPRRPPPRGDPQPNREVRGRIGPGVGRHPLLAQPKSCCVDGKEEVGIRCGQDASMVDRLKVRVRYRWRDKRFPLAPIRPACNSSTHIVARRAQRLRLL